MTVELNNLAKCKDLPIKGKFLLTKCFPRGYDAPTPFVMELVVRPIKR